MKTSLSVKMCQVYNKLMNHLQDRNIKMIKHILDNEASEENLNDICQNDI